MLIIKTYIAESKGKGVGVFAAEKIIKGQKIWLYDGNFSKTFNQFELEKMPAYQREFVEKYAYTDHSAPDLWILDLDNGRFMNHDENPNSDYDKFSGWATRDINIGEEITCNYRSFDTQELDFLK
jgi:SET domain-containing protein